VCVCVYVSVCLYVCVLCVNSYLCDRLNVRCEFSAQALVIVQLSVRTCALAHVFVAFARLAFVLCALAHVFLAISRLATVLCALAHMSVACACKTRIAHTCHFYSLSRKRAWSPLSRKRAWSPSIHKLQHLPTFVHVRDRANILTFTTFASRQNQVSYKRSILYTMHYTKGARTITLLPTF